jgi:hypothetical protein
MEEKKVIEATRLGVQDKRDVFQLLLAMCERLLQLNKFPVEMGDYALSLHPQEVEDAWLLLRQGATKNTLSPSSSTTIKYQPKGRSSAVFNLHAYEDVTGYQEKLLFMNVSKSIDISNSRRHYQAVKSWCERQLRLEEQLLTSIGAIKDIVRSCNTVGQYKKVSRDLLTFLPEQYKAGLKKYTKESPYPTGLNTEPQVIERMLGTLAYAALQPHHRSEESYKSRMNSYYKPSYTLQVFPRTTDYDRNPVRSLEI